MTSTASSGSQTSVHIFEELDLDLNDQDLDLQFENLDQDMTTLAGLGIFCYYCVQLAVSPRTTAIRLVSTLLMPLHYIMYHLLGGFLRRESDLKLKMKTIF